MTDQPDLHAMASQEFRAVSGLPPLKGHKSKAPAKKAAAKKTTTKKKA